MCFRNYRQGKTWLDKCLKSSVSENTLTGNVVNSPKHFFNLSDSTFIIFTDHCEGN